LPIIAGIYFSLQYAYSNSPVAGSGAAAPLAALAEYHAGQIGSLLIAATVVVSVLGNMTAGHTVSSRLTSSLADDRLLPAWFGKLSRWGTPANSIVFFGAGALAFALSGTFAALAVAASLARMVVWIPSFVALPVLRRAGGLAPLSGPLFVAVPVALVLSLWAAAQSSREQWLLIAAFLGAGTILFLIGRAAPRHA
jgi:amino acid transporter